MANLTHQKHFIKLDKLISERRRVVFEFSSSLKLFKKRRFFVEYPLIDKKPPESIAAIPFAAVMAPIAWATGARLIMPSLDKDYAASLEKSSGYFKRWFSKTWSFAWSLETSLVQNQTSPSRHALLFSGGLDSLTTYIRNKEKKPILFTIFGADIPLAQKDFIALCKNKFDEFAQHENVSIRYLYTDVREIFNDKRMKSYANDWYSEVAHGLMLSSLVAPAAYDSVKTLLMATCSHPPVCDYPCGSDKELVHNVRWAGSALENDNQGMSRVEKIRAHFKRHSRFHSYLRVCWMRCRSLNCGRCEKCLRTICELLVNDIDPAACNFKIGPVTLLYLKHKIEHDYYSFFHGENVLDFWRAIQAGVQLEKMQDRYGSREFFRWFAEHKRIQEHQNTFWAAFFSGLMRVKGSVGKFVKIPAKAIWKELTLREGEPYENFSYRRILLR